MYPHAAIAAPQQEHPEWICCCVHRPHHTGATALTSALNASGCSCKEAPEGAEPVSSQQPDVLQHHPMAAEHSLDQTPAAVDHSAMVDCPTSCTSLVDEVPHSRTSMVPSTCVTALLASS